MIGRLWASRLLSSKTPTWAARSLNDRSSIEPAPEEGVPAGAVLSAPWRGGGSSARFGTPSFLVWAKIMIAYDKAALIAEYEHLRREADKLDERSEQVETRLIELERLLPNNYQFPGDPPL